jgi:hypothetical protein
MAMRMRGEVAIALHLRARRRAWAVCDELAASIAEQIGATVQRARDDACLV